LQGQEHQLIKNAREAWFRLEDEAADQRRKAKLPQYGVRPPYQNVIALRTVQMQQTDEAFLKVVKQEIQQEERRQPEAKANP